MPDASAAMTVRQTPFTAMLAPAAADRPGPCPGGGESRRESLHLRHLADRFNQACDISVDPHIRAARLDRQLVQRRQREIAGGTMHAVRPIVRGLTTPRPIDQPACTPPMQPPRLRRGATARQATSSRSARRGRGRQWQDGCAAASSARARAGEAAADAFVTTIMTGRRPASRADAPGRRAEVCIEDHSCERAHPVRARAVRSGSSIRSVPAQSRSRRPRRAQGAPGGSRQVR